METVTGMQMVFTRVEPEYSPQRRSGFQTVYHSPGLPQEDVALIEQRVACFHPGEDRASRLQFFSLPDGLVVLTFSKGILADKQINDRYRSQGIFLVHCLVFAPGEFKKTNFNPFRIFDQAHFVQEPGQMVRDFNQAENREPPCRYDIDPFAIVQGGGAWWPSAYGLAAAASQARPFMESGRSWMFYGNAGEIEDALRAVFWLVPASLRMNCTFDTCIDGCSVHSGQFWAVGCASRRSEPFLAIPASGHSIQSGKTPLTEPDLYVDWLQKAAAQPAAAMFPLAGTMQELSEAFQHKREPANEALTEEACNEFYKIYLPMVLQNLKGMFGKNITPGLSDSLTEYLLQVVTSKARVLTIAAAQNMSLQQLCPLLRAWLKAQAPDFKGLKAGEWKALSQIAKRAADPLLMFWVAALSGEDANRKEALKMIGAGDYQQAMGLLFAPIAPEMFFSSQHVDILFQELALQQLQISDESFLELGRRLAGTRQLDHLEMISGRVHTLENPALTELEKTMRKEEYLPPSLVSAMHSRRRELGAPLNLLQRITGRK
jgi:hypothetical protein